MMEIGFMFITLKILMILLFSKRVIMSIIPFYGSKHPEYFQIERKAMDKNGVVLKYLNDALPSGFILDVGAGNGFTAEKLQREERVIIPMEPDEGMIDHQKKLLWTKGVAQDIPFHDSTFDAVYSTWAYFLPGIAKDTGLKEIVRVSKKNASIIIVDNAGEDEFTSFSPRTISDEGLWYKTNGFKKEILQSSYIFESIEEARKLMIFYFGEMVKEKIQKPEIEYKIAVYTKTV